MSLSGKEVKMFQIELNETLFYNLKIDAVRQKTTMRELVNKVLQEYLEKILKKEREREKERGCKK